MLTQCLECGLQVSDKAVICPHCGYPLKPELANKRYRQKTNRKRRLPNGFGQISEIKNRNLRKPFRVLVPVGKSPTGRPISKPLKPVSYFSTYNEAYAALVEYNKNPYDLSQEMTMQELFDRWSPEYFKTINTATGVRATKRAWKYCSEIYYMRVSDLRTRHIKGCIEQGIHLDTQKPADSRMKCIIKSMFNKMLDYALEYELVDRNYSRQFGLQGELVKETRTTKNEHIAFSEEEMSLLWQNIKTVKNVDMVLIQCYSGWRPQELCDLRIKNIDIENWSFVGGMKTDAGKNRFVPIHTRIRQLVLNRYNEAIEVGSEYLFNKERTYGKTKIKPCNYDAYKKSLDEIILALGLNEDHRPHDGRKHFVTMAKKYHVDEYAIKYIVGHSITDITEKTYTERERSWLFSEIEKIP